VKIFEVTQEKIRLETSLKFTFSEINFTNLRFNNLSREKKRVKKDKDKEKRVHIERDTLKIWRKKRRREIS